MAYAPEETQRTCEELEAAHAGSLRPNTPNI
jgi:hypothetical protein